VVDDEASIRELLGSYLSRFGFEVLTAADAKEASRLQAVEELHLVVLDMVLPDRDGLEVLAEFKAKRPHLPVIMLTGMGCDEQLIQQAQQAGGDGMVSKTQSLDEILLEVRRILNSKTPR